MKKTKSRSHRPAEPLDDFLRRSGLHHWQSLARLVNAAGIPQRRLPETPCYLRPETAPLFPDEPARHGLAWYLPLSAAARARIGADRDGPRIGALILLYLQLFSRTRLRSALENVRALCRVVATALLPDGTLPPGPLSWETISLVMSLPASLLDHGTARSYLSASFAAADRLCGPDAASAKRTAVSRFRKGRILLSGRVYPRYREAGLELPAELILFLSTPVEI